MIQQFHFWTFKYPENENTITKRYIYPHVHCSIIYNSQDMKTTINKWMDKENVTYRHTHTHTHTHKVDYYSRKKKRWNLAICYNMDGSQGHYSNWNKSDTERQITDDLSYMQNLKKGRKKIQITDWWLPVV